MGVAHLAEEVIFKQRPGGSESTVPTELSSGLKHQGLLRTPHGGTRVCDLGKPIKGCCEGRGQDWRTGHGIFSWYLLSFGSVSHGVMLLARVIGLMERSDDPIIGSAPNFEDR